MKALIRSRNHGGARYCRGSSYHTWSNPAFLLHACYKEYASTWAVFVSVQSVTVDCMLGGRLSEGALPWHLKALIFWKKCRMASRLRALCCGDCNSACTWWRIAELLEKIRVALIGTIQERLPIEVQLLDQLVVIPERCSSKSSFPPETL